MKTLDTLDPIDLPTSPLSVLLTARPDLADLALAARHELATAAA